MNKQMRKLIDHRRKAAGTNAAAVALAGLLLAGAFLIALGMVVQR